MKGTWDTWRFSHLILDPERYWGASLFSRWAKTIPLWWSLQRSIISDPFSNWGNLGKLLSCRNLVLLGEKSKFIALKSFLWWFLLCPAFRFPDTLFFLHGKNYIYRYLHNLSSEGKVLPCPHEINYFMIKFILHKALSFVEFEKILKNSSPRSISPETFPIQYYFDLNWYSKTPCPWSWSLGNISWIQTTSEMCVQV